MLRPMIRMDSVVLNWISNSISADLHQMVRECGCTPCHLWLVIENQFLRNREQRTLHLDADFPTFVQGDLSINEYCHNFKAMADDLADLGAPVEDRILTLNILQGLNQRFKHVGSIIRRYSPFLNFLKVWDDLLLEEIHMDSTGPPTAPAVKPPSSTPSRPPNGGNGGTGGNRNKYNNKNRNSGNGGGNNGGGGRGGRPHWFRRQDQRTVADLRPPMVGAHDCTSTLCLLDSSVRRPSWPHRASTCLSASCPGHNSSSSRRCISRPPWP
jgi:hypothetical protein